MCMATTKCRHGRETESLALLMIMATTKCRHGRKANGFAAMAKLVDAQH